jgi:Uma2 family endonuclease
MEAAPALRFEPQRWRWNVEAYYAAWEAGVFGDNPRLELIGGEVFQKLSPQNAPHATAVMLVSEALSLVRPAGKIIRCQLPLRLDDHNEPEPDIALVRGSHRDYEGRHPSASDVCLIVEVADRSLGLDRGRKRRLFAPYGVAEYWIVNLRSRQLEVFRNPDAGDYLERLTLPHGGSIKPLSCETAVRVADLLP